MQFWPIKSQHFYGGVSPKTTSACDNISSYFWHFSWANAFKFFAVILDSTLDTKISWNRGGREHCCKQVDINKFTYCWQTIWQLIKMSRRTVLGKKIKLIISTFTHQLKCVIRMSETSNILWYYWVFLFVLTWSCWKCINKLKSLDLLFASIQRKTSIFNLLTYMKPHLPLVESLMHQYFAGWLLALLCCLNDLTHSVIQLHLCLLLSSAKRGR